MMAQRPAGASLGWRGEAPRVRGRRSNAADIGFAVAWLGICAASCAMALATAMWAGV